MRVFLRKFWVEIMIFLCLLAGIFLLTEQMNLRGIIFETLGNLSVGTQRLMAGSIEKLQAFYKSLRLSDSIGIGLVLVALVVLVMRIRLRYMESEIYNGRTCPRCGSTFLRVHRTRWDKVLGKVTFIHFRRYRCSNRECGWDGRRKPGRRQKPLPDGLLNGEIEME